MKKLLNNIGIKVSLITIVVNVILFVFKLITGILGHSNAMISDAIHSLSDVLTTIVVIFGLTMSLKEADSKHPYGHERIECVFAIILAFFLFLTGCFIGYIGIKDIVMHSSIKIPTLLPLVGALVSIIVKEGMFHYTMIVAKKLKSSSMEADAWHHRSDALSSIGSFLGILGAKLGFPVLDPVCSVIICLIIVKTSINIFVSATTQMLDTACDYKTETEIIDLIKKTKEVIEITDMKTRMFANKLYIEVELSLDGNKKLSEVDKIVTKIHDKVESEFENVKHCNIRVIPNDYLLK